MKDTWKERWNEIDYIEWQKRSQHPSPVVVEDFIESLLLEREAEVRKEIGEEIESMKKISFAWGTRTELDDVRNNTVDAIVASINPKP